MNEQDYIKTLSGNIYNFRKERGLTQENLADKLNISFQAVSKWENGQSSPDIFLLPQLAEIFGCSIDKLFGRNAETFDLPLKDDNTLWGMVFKGRELVKNCSDLSNFIFKVEGDALNVRSNCNVSCGNVAGNVEAGVSVDCQSVSGDVNAGVNVTCCDVGGKASAGVSVSCQSMGK